MGEPTEYKSAYDNTLLTPIPRKLGRKAIGLVEEDEDAVELPFSGYDFWNCYEVSWLNMKGKPLVRILNVAVPCQSPFLVESKSFKLYLNSLNGTKFESSSEVEAILQEDLRKVTQADALYVKLLTLTEAGDSTTLSKFKAVNIDDIDVEISEYLVDSSILKLATSNENADAMDIDMGGACEAGIVEESLCSDLLKSNCLITNQPDWGSVRVHYKGQKIDQASLLKYFVSMRNHNEFHEQCVERIFTDINRECQPVFLTVCAKYTRRGGLDISPLRSNDPKFLENYTKDINSVKYQFKWRHIRQ